MFEDIIYFTEKAFLKTYVIERSKYIQSGDNNTWQPERRPAVIVIPGGGYQYIADSEDEPVVYHFLANGYSAFSLHYSLKDDSNYPRPLVELFQSIAYIRKNADKYWINPNQIMLCGFSAGAHLAALAATQFRMDFIENLMGDDYSKYMPNAAILCYPITNVSKLRAENRKRVMTWGKMLSEENIKVDVVKYVSENMCPTFLWHTRTDGIVPVSQSIELIEAMYENNVRFEAHIFGEGYHGLSTNDVLSNYKGAIQNGIEVPNVGLWVKMAINWSNCLFDFNI